MMVDPSELKGAGGGSKTPLIIVLLLLLVGGGVGGAWMAGLFDGQQQTNNGGGGVAVRPVRKTGLIWVVNSNPDGASIYLNGRFKGVTPRALRLKPAGFLHVRGGVRREQVRRRG